MKKYVFCVCWLLLTICKATIAQTPLIENIKKKIAAANNLTEKFKAIFELCEQRLSMNSDTLDYYAMMAKNLAIKTNDQHNRLWAEYYLISSSIKKGDLDKSLDAIDTAMLNAAEFPADKLLKTNLQKLRANAFIRKNQYKEAMAAFYSVLHSGEESGDTMTRIVGTNGIGWVYMEMEQYGEAIAWFYKAMQITNNQDYFIQYGLPLSNLAATYNSINKNDSAEYFVKIAIDYAKRSQNLYSLANCMNILADIYIDTGREPMAEQMLEEALKIREQIGDPYYIVSDMSQMAVLYASTKQTEKGINLCNEGIAMANHYGLTSKLPLLYDALAQNYKAAGDHEKYGETLTKIISLKDSLFQVNSAAALAELQTKYEVQRKENIITSQKFTLERNNYLLYGSLLLLLCVIVFAAIVFNEYGKRQRMQIRIMKEEERRATEQAVLTAEENQRKRIAADIHDNLGVKANAILYSTELLQQDEVKNETLLTDLRDTAKDMLLILRETLWAMKAADVEATDMWLRIINFSKQITRYYPHTKIAASGSAPETFIINSEVALNALLIIQEAVNNAIRHSTASLISIKSETVEGGWQMVVEDNGIGFDVETMRKKQDSYGLKNMVDRAKAAKLYIEINTQPLQGTSVIIRIPAAQTI
ncbi:MAG: tetratricopeptide repeat protein [Chitinophagaceae bacterium]